MWIIVDTAVYDVSKFADMHPGGSHVLLQVAGKGQSPSASCLDVHALEGMRRSIR